MAKGFFKSDDACREWWGKVAAVSDLYERRWTRLALKRIDPILEDRLAAQQRLFDAACLHGTVGEIELQGGGMVRGWMAAVSAMETAEVPDDAYVIGSDPVSGFKVAIGDSKPAAGRVVELFGQDVVWITPDEVAVMLASIEAFKSIAAVKKVFPGAEIVGLKYKQEGS